GGGPGPWTGDPGPYGPPHRVGRMSISSQSPESGPDLAAYLGRLGIGAAPSALPPTLATLRTVQRAQLLAIPFENLDPVRGIVPALEVPALEDKLVRRRRGGYCFELNGLLSAALAALGFTVRPLAGRVVLGVGDEGWASRPATHLALAVDTEEGTHLADAGFGALGALPGPSRCATAPSTRRTAAATGSTGTRTAGASRPGRRTAGRRSTSCPRRPRRPSTARSPTGTSRPTPVPPSRAASSSTAPAPTPTARCSATRP
ncbi:N-acetyltransferase, partial [Streptomyces sp. SolWspMP-sol7th]